jgi:hypothetical protein
MSVTAILRRLSRLLGGLDYFRLAVHSLSMNPVLSIKEVCRESSCPPAFSIRGSAKSSSSRGFRDVSCSIAYSRTVVPHLGQQNSAGTGKTL